MTDLLEFIVGLNPRVQYPPEELDREPVVIFDQSTWEAIVDDARAAIEAMQPTPQEAAKLLSDVDRENIVDAIESIICETHEMDVRDVDYAENIVSWLERHHPAALRAIAGEGQT